MKPDHPDSADQRRHYAELESRPVRPRRSPVVMAAAVWTWLAIAITRRRLRRVGFAAAVPAPPALLPWSSRRGVYGVLSRLSPTCLERSYVLQRWLSAHGVDFEVVVGVRRDEAGAIAAHAWIEELTTARERGRYTEIHRVPAPAA
ncbi:lasso peptide biosynthesis B2 protein [Nocardioides mangrovicus]|uniref:Lasso peptide biosynthesis B2 protein n=1 Tax=Nocardioides mangrovicus TaxID=2478913 RepID=A0A3L8NX40_9ACTN|nr:lasso peptide biosynthesis B2 protein [Nocardioides mangrovicus]RLV47494.1 lasso peptide biosynthesis B2 protein [Nocardioides mangrovicus]